MKVDRDTWDSPYYCTVLYTMYMYICTCTHLGCKGVSSGRKQFKIYGPAHFAATWKKYLEICDRDGLSASREIRKYVKAQVDRRYPGNPVPPLTAFFEGHPDVAARAWSTTIKELVARAEGNNGELLYTFVRQTLKDQGLKGHMLATRAESMCKTLKSLGVKIWH